MLILGEMPIEQVRKWVDGLLMPDDLKDSVLYLCDQIADLKQQLAESRERLAHYRNRVWLAMTDIAAGQAMRGYDVLKSLSDEIEQALQAAEEEVSDGHK